MTGILPSATDAGIFIQNNVTVETEGLNVALTLLIFFPLFVAEVEVVVLFLLLFLPLFLHLDAKGNVIGAQSVVGRLFPFRVLTERSAQRALSGQRLLVLVRDDPLAQT